VNTRARAGWASFEESSGRRLLLGAPGPSVSLQRSTHRSRTSVPKHRSLRGTLRASCRGLSTSCFSAPVCDPANRPLPSLPNAASAVAPKGHPCVFVRSDPRWVSGSRQRFPAYYMPEADGIIKIVWTHEVPASDLVVFVLRKRRKTARIGPVATRPPAPGAEGGPGHRRGNRLRRGVQQTGPLTWLSEAGCTSPSHLEDPRRP